MATANKSTGSKSRWSLPLWPPLLLWLWPSCSSIQRGNERDEQLSRREVRADEGRGESCGLGRLANTERHSWVSPIRPEVGKCSKRETRPSSASRKSSLAEVPPGDTPATVEATLHRLDRCSNTVRQERQSRTDIRLELKRTDYLASERIPKTGRRARQARKDAEKDLSEARGQQRELVKEKENRDRRASGQGSRTPGYDPAANQEIGRIQEAITKKTADKLEKINHRPAVEKDRFKKPSFEAAQRNCPIGRSGYEARVDQPGSGPTHCGKGRPSASTRYQ